MLFDALGTEELAKIVDISLRRLNARLADRRIRVEVTQAAKDWLALTGFDPVYGARPLRRLIQTTIEDAAGPAGAGRRGPDGDVIAFDVDEAKDGLVVVQPTALAV